MQFHLLISKMTSNPLLMEAVQRLWDRHYSPTFLRLEQHYANGALLKIWDRDHQVIVNAITRRDPRGARTAMRKHLKNVLERLFRPIK
jgi:DNA-binding FadR family transcriptional regulator